jgi:AraC-like DNA-binding protein
MTVYMLYDTRNVHPLDRYDYYRAGAAGEFAPVTVSGGAPGALFATMSVAQIGPFKVETVTWGADSELVARRTHRLIRACDPECYRLFVPANAGPQMEQAGNQVSFRARDVALYDLSRPWQATHRPTREPMRVIMLTFPRALVPISRATIEPVIGRLMPRAVPGRGLVAQFLVEVSETPANVDAEVLLECVVGLIRRRIGQQEGVSPRTRRLLQMMRIRSIIGRHLGDPALDPEGIAKAANISPRYLHAIFQDAELSPMQLVKRIRLEECRRGLQDPALATTPIKDIIAAHGYVRSDQFARDFKQLYGVSASEVRRLGRMPRPSPEG